MKEGPKQYLIDDNGKIENYLEVKFNQFPDGGYEIVQLLIVE